MVNPIIENYLKDTNVPIEKRQLAIQNLSQGADQTEVATMITQKYGDVYLPKQVNLNQSVEERQSFGQKFKENFVSGLGLGDKGGLLSPVIGAGKGALETVRGIPSLMERTGRVGANVFLPESKEVPLSKPTSFEQLIPQELTESKNIGEGIGKFAEQTAEYLIPGAAGLKTAKGAGLVAKVGMGALQSGLVTAAQTGGDVKQTAISAGMGGAFPLAGAVLSKILPKKPTIDAVVGKIVQGNKADIEPAKKALQMMDTTGVKTYSDLVNVADDYVKVLAGSVDDLLGDVKKTFKPNDFVTVIKEGKTTLKQNFLSKALNHLDELYTKTDSLDDLVKIKELKKKWVKSGLSLKKSNQIAREYGQNFGKKAFNARTGEALTSVNASQFENVRKGVKNVVRDKIKEDAPKFIDEQISKVFTVKRLASEMAEKVNALSQKVTERGLVENIARKTGRGIDIATFGGIRGFLTSFLPSNIGNKTMNSLDLQNILAKNLKSLDKLLKAGDDEAVNGIAKLLKENLPKAIAIETVTDD